MESTFLSSPGRPLRLGDAVLLKKFIIHKNAVLATPAPRPAAVGTGHAFCFIVLEIILFSAKMVLMFSYILVNITFSNKIRSWRFSLTDDSLHRINRKLSSGAGS